MFEVYFKAKGRWAWKGFRTKENRTKWINKNKHRVEITGTCDPSINSQKKVKRGVR